MHMEHLFALTDSVALLDMLAGFADLVALSPHVYTRPRLLATSTPSTGAGMPTAGGLQHQPGPHLMVASADPVSGAGPGPDTHAGALVIKTGRHAIISTFKQVCNNMHQCKHGYQPTYQRIYPLTHPRYILFSCTHSFYFSFHPFTPPTSAPLGVLGGRVLVLRAERLHADPLAEHAGGLGAQRIGQNRLHQTGRT